SHRIAPMRLVIDRIRNDDPIGFEPVPEGESRMIQVLSDDACLADLEAALGQVVEADRGPTLPDRDRKAGVLHLPRWRRRGLLVEAAWRIDVPLVLTVEERREEREALNVVPVGVRDQEVAAQGTLVGGGQCESELVRAGTAVQNNKGAIMRPHLDA